jgi:hypothetical protein
MDLNLNKCQCISFSLKQNPIHFSYFLNNVEIERVSEVTDLGVILTSDLNFDAHIQYACKKASKMIGFIRRSCRNFSPDTLKLLYVSIVRPLSEYASIIWSPFHVTKIDHVERIQRNFLRFWCYKKGLQFNKNLYSNICKNANLLSLKARRETSDLIFLHKIINNHVNSKYLVNCVSLHAPLRINRSFRIFKPPFPRIHVYQNHFCSRSQNLYNEIVGNINCKDLDIFSMSLVEFKNKIFKFYK